MTPDEIAVQVYPDPFHGSSTTEALASAARRMQAAGVIDTEIVLILDIVIGAVANEYGG